MQLTQTLIERADASSSFVADADTRMTYGELAARVERFAQALQCSDVLGDERCPALALGNDIPSLVALLALLETGASCALLQAIPDAPPDCPAFCDTLVLPARDAGPAGFRLQSLPGRTATQTGSGRLYLQTSGSSGQPKWAVHTADSLAANAAACRERLAIDAHDRVLIPVPIHHMYGLGAGLVPSLMAAASVVLVPRGNPLEIFARERERDPTIAFLVPSQCRSLLAMRRRPRPYRYLVVAGDRLGPDEADAFEALHGKVVSLYGSTELGAVAAGSPDDAASVRHRTCGTLLPGISVCHPEGGAPAPAGETLELCFRHPSGFAGYADDLGRIAEAPGCVCTHDLGRCDAEGRLQVLGRADHAVKRDGLLVHFSDLEACLSRAPGVTQAAVVKAGTSRRGAGLTAFCTLSDPQAATPEGLRRHCICQLPPRAVPDRIRVVAELPILASGKLDRHELARRAEIDDGA